MTIPKSANIAFPHFDLEHVVPEFDGKSDAAEETKRYYNTKEDQDVAVFLAISKRLPLQSLLHLLQDHARSQSNVLPPRTTSSKPPPTTPEKSLLAAPTKKQVTKSFRFATGATVRTIPSIKHFSNLWWSDAEMQTIRQDAIDTVLFVRQHRPEFSQTVQDIWQKAQEADDRLPEIAAQPTRGLETHIVDCLSQARSDTVQAVLEEQRECQRCKDSYELTCESLRGQSAAYSLASRSFATQMGSCDHLQALKAVLADWKK